MQAAGESLAHADAPVVPATAASAPSQPPIVDVWSRTAPRYRIRAVALLLLNLGLYCGLCAFSYWLREARLIDFSLASYSAPATFWESDAPNLNNYILEPINVMLTPVHALVLGQLIGVLVAIPICIAILYRFPFGLPFVAAVLVFAHMPWLAFTLLLSISLASLQPFRLRFRFGSGLLALTPVLAYLFLATRGDVELLQSASPLQRTLLATPWILAILVAVAALATVLLLARAVNYRPGAVAPVMAVMFVSPIALFHWRVGADELAYRVLEREYGPRARVFGDNETTEETQRRIRALIHDWTSGSGRDSHLADLAAAWGSEINPFKRLVWRAWAEDLLRQRFLAYEACKRFIADYPDSRYVTNALYLQARALDMRLDERRLAQSNPRREYYHDFPHAQSESAWHALLHRDPASPLAAAAALRLAELHVRRGEISAAREALGPLLARASDDTPPATQAARSVFAPAPAPHVSLGFEARPFLTAIRRLDELLVHNSGDSRHASAPLQQLFSLDPRRPLYAENLQSLLLAFPDAELADNVELRLILADSSDPELQAQRLAGLLERRPDGDAFPEAALTLANWELSDSTNDRARFERGRARMLDVAQRFPDSIWGDEARDRLRTLDPVTARGGAVP